MKKIIALDESYSTTRRLVKSEPRMIAKHVKQWAKQEDQFETEIFLPAGKNRQGEGGLRTKGYFKVGGIISSRQGPHTSLLTTKPTTDQNPLITVVTVVYNGEQYLEETILSVINQTYDNLEYIIIDGGSTDGTLDIIKKYEHAIDYWVSEKDNGISDAFNKAVRVNLGLYVNFQGDGDGFIVPDSLQNLIGKDLDDSHVFISARIQRVDGSGGKIYTSKYIKSFNPNSLLFKMSMPHQGLLTHYKYFKQFGLFDVENKFCMDYEHLLRSFASFPSVKTSRIVLAKWRADGLGNGKTMEILNEYKKIKKKNEIASSAIVDMIYIWSLCKYYVKSAWGCLSGK